jgi:hypothetical protein
VKGTDDDELDFENTDVKRWRTRAVDRTEWASVVREAKARLGGGGGGKEEGSRKSVNGNRNSTRLHVSC